MKQSAEGAGPDEPAQTSALSREDLLLGGQVRLSQSDRGYRAGMDAALLAAACDAGPTDRVLDLGCGPGAVMLAAACRRPRTRFVGIERDPEAVAMIQGNIVLNGLQDRVQALGADIASGFAGLGLDAFDAALCNPPFFDDPASLRAPSPARLGAYMADDGLAAWVGFLLKAVRQGGAVTVIHRADRLGDLLQLLSDKAGSIRVRPVQPYDDQPAKRVLVRAIKSGKAPLMLLPALILHDRSGAKHTAEAEAIFRGEAALDWGQST